MTVSRLYRKELRLAYILARLMDRFPRLTSFSLWGLSLWALWYIFMNYNFTTHI